MKAPRICIATRNAHKLDEIRTILGLPGLIGAGEIPNLPDVVEDGQSFEENAIKKAVTLARAAGMWAIGDDSGLMVTALDGAPGIYSARFAGEGASDAENNQKLLSLLAACQDRRACFCCVLALSDPAGHCRVVTGTCPGTILHQARGHAGFGYDPLFLPDGYDCSFAEMRPDRKHAISHRGAALRKARAAWAEVLGGSVRS